MTTPAHAVEADRASVAFQIALTQIGVKTIEEALDLWHDLPPTAKPETASRWLERAVQMVLTRRLRSRDLATAYYRLVRALRTGTTIPDPRHPEPTHVSLGDLRSEFDFLTKEAAAERPQEGRTEATPNREALAPNEAASESHSDAHGDDDADRILIEEIERLQEEADRLEREAEEEVRIALEALGPANLNARVREIDQDASAAEVDALREAAHLQAGAQQAAAAERVVMDGGRGTIWSYARRDKRAIGYVRLSRTGTPCGWCAMLISRGPVYKSEASATYAEGDLYHDNCHCYAEPIFSTEQYDGSDMFELNRKYHELWPKVTKGLSGKAAVSAWRSFIRREQKVAAQVAARSSTTAQEA